MFAFVMIFLPDSLMSLLVRFSTTDKLFPISKTGILNHARTHLDCKRALYLECHNKEKPVKKPTIFDNFVL